jgi:hypothetical protein
VLAKLLTAGVAPNGDTILLTMGNLEDCRSRFCSSSLSSDRFRSSLKSVDGRGAATFSRSGICFHQEFPFVPKANMRHHFHFYVSQLMVTPSDRLKITCSV